MVIGAVICEFNPFHNGHKHLLDKMREDGCDCIVAVMSTSFTQRGDVAVYSKFTRAQDALAGGADIVIELPVVWAVSSAQRFAQAGCEIIKALGCVNRVYFGSECGDTDALIKAEQATLDAGTDRLVKELMAQGEYYPSAVEKAVCQLHGKEAAEILASPNNTLGIEYIKSLRDSNIEVRTVKRVGAEHDSEYTDDSFASASKIRKDIMTEEFNADFIPESNTKDNNPAFYEFAERAVLYALRSMTPTDFEQLPDVSEGLHNRIHNAVRTESTIDGILSKIKTKRYTLARLRRILTCAILGITKEHQAMSVPYIRVLGFNSTGELLLKNAKTTSTLHFIVNVAGMAENLSDNARKILEIEMKATDIRTIFEKSPTACGQDFTKGIIKV
ncbi:MAG: nucleotidyltransferase family protein [Ruminococcus sp.]|nr:nucleotidyltransferase family protein [Ruminococcus sp.]